jgi:hypothetical protein
MRYHVSLSDGQFFEVEMPSRETIEWFLRMDFPDAILVREGSQITARKDATAYRDGQQPVAVVERAGTPASRAE